MITRLKIILVRLCLWYLRRLTEETKKKKNEIREQTMTEAFRVMDGKSFKLDGRTLRPEK